jgi:hypothetical protein
MTPILFIAHFSDGKERMRLRASGAPTNRD